MSQSPMTPEERFAMIVEELLSYPNVRPPLDGPQAKKGFGSNALKVSNKIFAMLVRGKFVVKLPKQRVDALVASGTAEHFVSGANGRSMKEWLAVEPTSDAAWLPLAREAMEFVASQR